ncbi:MAG: hypothetical protein IPN65_00110 [Elusimicrobia bacterium]|nr:hypothetical protein [Elusimicrobiota bacterium]MBK7573646.1 hypothetical protein [Elusimicrobiota bacterium]MBK8422911.1 hypothetical protein [Elusimicrobiota bacterium]MBK9057344.1 hypothetical protein [Elusimicrobiota bacterium]MBK9428917.1 hypothetical protein [Elusimicrobiota bacterium]
MTTYKATTHCPICKSLLDGTKNSAQNPAYILDIQPISFVWCGNCGRYEVNLEALKNINAHLKSKIMKFLTENKVEALPEKTQQSLPLIIASQGNPKLKTGQQVLRI